MDSMIRLRVAVLQTSQEFEVVGFKIRDSIVSLRRLVLDPFWTLRS